MSENSTSDELDPAAGTIYRIWRKSARYAAPIAILLVLLYATGALDRFSERFFV